MVLPAKMKFCPENRSIDQMRNEQMQAMVLPERIDPSAIIKSQAACGLSSRHQCSRRSCFGENGLNANPVVLLAIILLLQKDTGLIMRLQHK